MTEPDDPVNEPPKPPPPESTPPALSPPPNPYVTSAPAALGVPNVAPYPAQSAASYPPPYGVQKPPTVLSLLSMIFGIAGIVLICCGVGFLLAVGAVVLGHLGLKKEQARGMAIAGLITGYIGVGIGLLLLIVWLGGTLLPLMAYTYQPLR